MNDEGIDYINAFAKFNDKDQVEFQLNGETHTLQAKSFVVATGNRPRMYPGLPELEKYAITSDDLFSLDRDPGKTLVVGGGYIAVECAGFLRGLGKEVLMVNRSSFLRVMDNDMSFRIVDDMEGMGTNVMPNTVPVAVRKTGENLFEVDLKTGDKITTHEVNTILVAIGRDAQPDKLGLSNAGVDFAKSLKIQGRKEEIERSSIDNIYAVGDVLEGVPELMPVAQKSGKLVARRIFERLSGVMTEQEILDKFSTDYTYIPTTVFSPTEYSFVGMSEQEAIQEYGEDAIEVYHREVTPLQFSIVKNNMKTAYMKVICNRNDNEKVLGIHYFGPSADEIIAGYAVAMKLGLKKEHLDSSIGVHPSTGEEFFNLDVTKRSGGDYAKSEC